MNTDIFIRTHIRDVEFLVHAIRTIEHRVNGYRNLIVTCPDKDVRRIASKIERNVIGVRPMPDDYVGQQFTKMSATEYTDADVICFWDSDTVATQPIDLSDLLFHDGRLILHHVPYEGLSDGSQVWRSVVARDMGATPEFEFMRRLPLAYHRSTLVGCVDHLKSLHGMPLDAYMKRLPRRSFTEFNCAGMWAYANERDRYDWRIDEAEVQQWKALVKQFWSWGGITREIRDQIAKYAV
jgi:hypothetical protein